MLRCRPQWNHSLTRLSIVLLRQKTRWQGKIRTYTQTRTGTAFNQFQARMQDLMRDSYIFCQHMLRSHVISVFCCLNKNYNMFLLLLPLLFYVLQSYFFSPLPFNSPHSFLFQYLIPWLRKDMPTLFFFFSNFYKDRHLYPVWRRASGSIFAALATLNSIKALRSFESLKEDHLSSTFRPFEVLWQDSEGHRSEENNWLCFFNALCPSEKRVLGPWPERDWGNSSKLFQLLRREVLTAA